MKADSLWEARKLLKHGITVETPFGCVYQFNDGQYWKMPWACPSCGEFTLEYEINGSQEGDVCCLSCRKWWLDGEWDDWRYVSYGTMAKMAIQEKKDQSWKLVRRIVIVIVMAIAIYWFWH